MKSFLCLVIVTVGGLGHLTAAPTQSLAERLGYKPTDKILIVNGDDVGMCHAANEATIESLEKGLMTSATMMVPCPWFNEIADYAKRNPQRDFGIHLCHTSEWKFYRWGPVAPRDQVPGLLDPDGYLTLIGRIKELINRGGEKISPLEVDAVLLTHPAVAEVATFAAPDPMYGEEVHAAVVLKVDATPEELQAHCRSRLADFKVPKVLHITKELPRTATGKVQRRHVASTFLGPSKQ